MAPDTLTYWEQGGLEEAAVGGWFERIPIGEETLRKINEKKTGWWRKYVKGDETN